MSYPTFSSLFQGAGVSGQQTQNQPNGPGGVAEPQHVQTQEQNPWSQVQQQGAQEQFNTWATAARPDPTLSSGGKV